MTTVRFCSTLQRWLPGLEDEQLRREGRIQAHRDALQFSDGLKKFVKASEWARAVAIWRDVTLARRDLRDSRQVRFQGELSARLKGTT
jgi:hypothetical protein